MSPPWTQRLFDSFTDHPATRLPVHSPEQGLGYTDIAVGWLTAGSSYAAIDAIGAVVFNETLLKPNQALEGKVTSLFTDGTFCLLARVTGTNSADWCGYAAQYDVAGVTRLFRVDSGVFTQLGADASIVISGDSFIRLECDHATLTVLFNGVEKIKWKDSTYTAGRIGLYATDPSALVDELYAYDRPGNNSGGGGKL